MNKSHFWFLAILLLIVSCKKEVETLSDLKSDFFELPTKQIRLGDSLQIQFNENADKIDSLELVLNGKRIENSQKLEVPTANLGLNTLEIKVYVDGNPIWGKTEIGILNPEKETPITFELIKEHPHPKELFTQGFFYHANKIYESSGQYGKSKLVTYSLGQTQFDKETKLDPKDFAEGACLLNGNIYQLTYRERKVFVYNPQTLELTKTLELPAIIKEGWGLATNGNELIVSDGTQNLYFLDELMNVKKKIQVAGNVSIYTNLNEMEFINGKIFANVWTTNYVLIINPDSGAVESYYDLTQFSETKGSDDVLNGIALYGNNLLFTGKNWEKIYEITLSK